MVEDMDEGTSIALKALHTNGHESDFNVVAINIATIIRNMYDKDASDLKLMQRFKTELAQILESIVNCKHLQERHIPVVFYGVDYAKIIPKEHLRKQTTVHEVVAKLVRRIILTKENYFGNDCRGVRNNIPLFFIGPPMTGIASVERLAKSIQDVSGGNKVLLMSHVPMDFHMYKYFNNFTVLETHTGAYKNTFSFSKKVFNKYDMIPFFPCTHALFGDTKGYVAPMIGIKEKRILVELCEKNKWKHKMESSILNDIKKHLKLTPWM